MVRKNYTREATDEEAHLTYPIREYILVISLKIPPLATNDYVSNRGGVRGSGSGHPPKKVGLAKSRLQGRLAGREADNEDDDIMGNLE